jgi:hypothetical protein
MPVENQLALHHSNRYSADSACVCCEGVIRHESWCATQNAIVHYAFQAVLDPKQLSLGDELILHGLGVVWTAEGIQGE